MGDGASRGTTGHNYFVTSLFSVNEHEREECVLFVIAASFSRLIAGACNTDSGCIGGLFSLTMCRMQDMCYGY